jgi:Flp pilus assembly pilin Flp
VPRRRRRRRPAVPDVVRNPAATGGQGVVEYGLILSGSALVTVLTLVFLGPVLSEVLRFIGEAIDAATHAR